MNLDSQKSLPSLMTRLFSMLPAGWMLVVLLLFIAIRVIGSRSFQSLHVFGKAH